MIGNACCAYYPVPDNLCNVLWCIIFKGSEIITFG